LKLKFKTFENDLIYYKPKVFLPCVGFEINNKNGDPNGF
jgi:hypothetical protein